MKYLLFSLLFASQGAYSQQFEYLTASYIVGGFNSKTTVTIDSGDKVLGTFKKSNILEDSTGKSEFKSPVSALNYLGSLGWEAVSYHVSNTGGVNTQVVLFKKRKQ